MRMPRQLAALRASLRAVDPSDDVSVRRRLRRSFWSVVAGVLILAMLGALAFMVVTSAPLWTWAIPATAELPLPGEDPEEEDQP
jgi:hypothetical protein